MNTDARVESPREEHKYSLNEWKEPFIQSMKMLSQSNQISVKWIFHGSIN